MAALLIFQSTGWLCKNLQFDPLTHGSVSLSGGYNATENKLQTYSAVVDSLARSTRRIWLLYPPQYRLVIYTHSTTAGWKKARRIEPRAVKCRPKPFPLLTQPRTQAREEVRENGHPKKLK
jgi:hypothetical protein